MSLTSRLQQRCVLVAQALAGRWMRDEVIAIDGAGADADGQTARIANHRRLDLGVERPAGVLRTPAAPEQPQTILGAEMRLDPADGPSAPGRQEGISRFSRSRAARTRFR